MKQKNFDILAVLRKSTKRAKPSFICCLEYRISKKLWHLKLFVFLKTTARTFQWLVMKELSLLWVELCIPISSLNIINKKRNDDNDKATAKQNYSTNFHRAIFLFFLKSFQFNLRETHKLVYLISDGAKVLGIIIKFECS